MLIKFIRILYNIVVLYTIIVIYFERRPEKAKWINKYFRMISVLLEIFSLNFKYNIIPT